MQLDHKSYFEFLDEGLYKKLEKDVEYQSMMLVRKHGKDNQVNVPTKDSGGKNVHHQERIRPQDYL